MSKYTPEIGMEIVGHGAYLPQRRLSNTDISRSIAEHGGPADIDPAWIEQMTGIKERPRINAGEGENTADLAVEAGRMALQRSGIDPESINYLLVATSTSPMQVPATVNEVQDRLGIKGCLCMDIGAACSGFVHGMIVSSGLLSVGQNGDRVMLIGADAASIITDQSDPDTAIIFADGAGAMIFERKDGSESGILGKSFDNDGSKRDLFYAPHGQKITMKGSELAKVITRLVVKLTAEALQNAGMAEEDIDYTIMHQPNGRIIDLIAKKTRIPREKIAYIIDRIGNSSAATVPITYAESFESGAFSKGSILMFNGVAVGIGGSSVIFRDDRTN